MDDFTTTLSRLDEQLDEAIAADPLDGLSLTAAVQRDIAARQRAAVRAAVQEHSWNEIGAALGVSKQAAHQKWANELKEEVKAEAKAFKTLMKQGDLRKAADAKDKLDAVIDELKQAHVRRR